jgi:hypothetical protein
MKIGHFLEYDAPYDDQEKVNVGRALWLYRSYHHGDSSVYYSLVDGYFYMLDNTLYFELSSVEGQRIDVTNSYFQFEKYYVFDDEILENRC